MNLLDRISRTRAQLHSASESGGCTFDNTDADIVLADCAAALAVIKEWMESQPAAGLSGASVLDNFREEHPELFTN